MTRVWTAFEEASATIVPVSLPLAHLSVELGHLYMEDFAGGPARLREMFGQVAPWAKTAAEACAAGVRPQKPRISTCFLVDDYFTQFSSPREVVPMLVDAAQAQGIQIDYLAREAGCAQAEQVPLAQLVAERLVADPPAGTNGTRPPVQETGWLSNGVRSPHQPPHEPLPEAMQRPLPWQPPRENAANRHSIFVDVELWDEPSGSRTWSCPFLAAVWQLVRLGVLRMRGQPVVRPHPWQGDLSDLPDAWPRLPPVVQLNPSAAPFTAYRTLSVLARRFLPIEHAVRTILSQVQVEPGITADLEQRVAREGLLLPAEVVDRIEYVFTGAPWRPAG